MWEKIKEFHSIVFDNAVIYFKLYLSTVYALFLLFFFISLLFLFLGMMIEVIEAVML
jgi:hypothetical protein